MFIDMRLLKLQPKARDILKSLSVINMNENKIVYELNKDKKTSIASFTKIMTI